MAEVIVRVVVVVATAVRDINFLVLPYFANPFSRWSRWLWRFVVLFVLFWNTSLTLFQGGQGGYGGGGGGESSSSTYCRHIEIDHSYADHQTKDTRVVVVTLVEEANNNREVADGSKSWGRDLLFDLARVRRFEDKKSLLWLQRKLIVW